MHPRQIRKQPNGPPKKAHPRTVTRQSGSHDIATILPTDCVQWSVLGVRPRSLPKDCAHNFCAQTCAPRSRRCHAELFPDSYHENN